jgi:light-regulated signal transduction histidine kinase (bacteriophytochrome)
MEEMVRDVWQELLAANPGRKMTLKLGKMPAASGDWSMIRQVYANLLENAVKFAEGRNPTVIEVGSLAGEEGAVYYVWDNGIGFDMKFHDKLFGVFKRLHTDAEFEGTGIGLSLVQRIVHRHGGKIWAEGEVDKGATFSFTLPTRQE